MKAFILSVLLFLAILLLAGSKYAYNPPEVKREFCQITSLCDHEFFQQNN